MTPANKTKYIRVLLWAYEKGDLGFAENEILSACDLSDRHSRSWYLKTFRNGDVPLIDARETNTTTEAYWILTHAGMSAAINYITLETVKKSSEDASRLARWAIGIGVTVGIVQIILGGIQIVLALNG